MCIMFTNNYNACINNNPIENMDHSIAHFQPIAVNTSVTIRHVNFTQGCNYYKIWGAAIELQSVSSFAQKMFLRGMLW